MAAFTGLLVLQAFVYYTSGVVDCGVLPRTHTVVALPVCTRNCSSDETSYSPHKCSCSESCSVFEDCCHDSPHRNAALWQRFDFVCVAVAGVGRFRAVSSCPEDQPSDLCEANLGYLAPVTSGATGTTYGNYYCAWCNDDSEHLVTWEVDLDCLPSSEKAGDNSSFGPFYIAYKQDEFSRINLQEKTESLCQFHVHGGNASFLENLELRPCGTTEMISECSASWKDISVVEKCRSYENPVYHYDTAYRNPHCAQCNFLHLSHVRCEPHSSEAEGANPKTARNSRARKLDRNLPRSEGRPYSFSQLFTINATEWPKVADLKALRT